METLSILWDACPHNPPWDISHLAYLVSTATNSQVLQYVLSSKTAHALFTSLNPQDKASFLREVVEKDHEMHSEIMKGLHAMPYAGFACLKFP
jgi:hypothetical protein